MGLLLNWDSDSLRVEPSAEIDLMHRLEGYLIHHLQESGAGLEIKFWQALKSGIWRALKLLSNGVCVGWGAKRGTEALLVLCSVPCSGHWFPLAIPRCLLHNKPVIITLKVPWTPLGNCQMGAWGHEDLWFVTSLLEVQVAQASGLDVRVGTVLCGGALQLVGNWTMLR